MDRDSDGKLVKKVVRKPKRKKLVKRFLESSHNFANTDDEDEGAVSEYEEIEDIDEYGNPVKRRVKIPKGKKKSQRKKSRHSVQ